MLAALLPRALAKPIFLSIVSSLSVSPLVCLECFNLIANPSGRGMCFTVGGGVLGLVNVSIGARLSLGMFKLVCSCAL